MNSLTTPEIEEKIKSYLNYTFQKRKGHDGHGGWARYKGDTVAIVNTVEALLTLREIDALDDYLRDAYVVKKYLLDEVNEILGQKVIKTGYLAYGAIGLNMIGEHELRDVVIERLLQLTCNGGWPKWSNQDNAALVSTFQAMFALQQIGKPVDQLHYDWLTSHQKLNDNLCSFAPTDTVTSIGASCLVLYLLVKGGHTDKYYTRDLANAVQSQLNDTFTQMSGVSEAWVSEDPYTHYKIYGYGLGLRGLHGIGILNHKLVGVGRFLEALSVWMVSISEEQPTRPLSCDPSRTWVPAVLELAIAVRTISDFFDPIKFYSELVESPAAVSDDKQVTIERELRLIDLQKNILVAQEREILKRDNLVEQVIANQETLVKHISENQETLVEHINERLIATIQEIDERVRITRSEYLKKVAVGVLSIILWGIGLLMIMGFVALRLIKPDIGNAIADTVGIIGSLIVVTMAVIHFVKGRSKT